MVLHNRIACSDHLASVGSLQHNNKLIFDCISSSRCSLLTCLRPTRQRRDCYPVGRNYSWKTTRFYICTKEKVKKKKKKKKKQFKIQIKLKLASMVEFLSDCRCRRIRRT